MFQLANIICLATIFAPVAVAQLRPPQATPFLNVATDTPHGEFRPGDDIADALQWSIDNQASRSFKPYVPRGVWRYSRPLRIRNVDGGWLVGMGRGQARGQKHGNWTTLRYTGPADQPSLTYQGKRWRIEDICFAGRMLHEKTEPRPQLGLLITKRKGQSEATTQLHLSNVLFSGWETAIQNGEGFSTHNCEMHVLTDVRFFDCGIGFWNKNKMGMSHHFVRCDMPNSVGTWCRFDAGGMVFFTDVLVGGGGKGQRFLVTAGRVGQASGGFYFDGVKLDGSMTGKGGFQLIEMSEPAAADFVVERLRTSNTNYEAGGGLLATLRGDATLAIRDGYRPAKIVCHASGYPAHWPAKDQRVMRPHILVDNCRLRSGKVTIEGPHSLVLRDCVDWHRGPKGHSPSPRVVPNIMTTADDADP